MNIQKKEDSYVSQIKDIINNAQEYTESDMDAILTALVRKIARDTELLDFEERLENSKDFDLY